MTDNNTRRYPRTIGEAFKDASYADPIERPACSGYPSSWWLAMALIVVSTLWVIT